MDHCLELFCLETRLVPIQLEMGAGCDIERLKQLVKEYDHIYFFTDEFIADHTLTWLKILESKITVINVMKEKNYV